MGSSDDIHPDETKQSDDDDDRFRFISPYSRLLGRYKRCHRHLSTLFIPTCFLLFSLDYESSEQVHQLVRRHINH